MPIVTTPGGRVDTFHLAAYAMPLPFFALVRLLLIDIGFLHADNGYRDKCSLVISRLATHQNAIACLQIAQLDGLSLLSNLSNLGARGGISPLG